MKTAKLIIGVVSIVLFIFILFQSCVVGIGNAISENEESSGSAGLMLSILFLIAGIVGVATRNSKGGGITTGIFYTIAAIIGLSNAGTFGDLIVWSVLSLIFGTVFIVGSVTMKKPSKKENEEQ